MSERSDDKGLRQLHDRLGSMIDQVGQPDYSLRELVDGLREVRDELFALSHVATPDDFEKMRLALEYIAKLPDSYPTKAITERAREALPSSEVPHRSVSPGTATENYAGAEDGKFATPSSTVTHVPGLWRCAKCKLDVLSTNLHVYSGTTSANTEPHECPNGCGPMWRVSEADYRKELLAQVNRLFYENRALKEAQPSATAAPILEEALYRCASYHQDEAMLDAPCIFCDYIGVGYWQKGTHAKDCRWHSVGGYADRHRALQRRGTTDGTATKP